jgi:hypothetical protein
MNEKSTEKKLSRNIEIIDSQIDDETVMMDVEKGAYYGLNNIGSAIWDALEEPKTISNLIDVLTKKYEVSSEECEKDITPFIEQMTKAELLIES